MADGNVYGVIAGTTIMLFEREADAEEYSALSANEPVHRLALRTKEDADELLADWREANDG